MKIPTLRQQSALAIASRNPDELIACLNLALESLARVEALTNPEAHWAFPPAAISEQVRSLWHGRRPIEAIQLLREQTGCSILTAKRALELQVHRA